MIGALTEAGRAAIHGLAWAVLVATMAPPVTACAAFAGGFIGSMTGASLARTRLRTSVVSLAALIAIGFVVWLRWALIGGSALAATIGPVGAMRASAILTAVLCPAIVSATLRTSSSRRAIFAVLELLLVAIAFTQLFIPHRNGAINRPFYLADWIIALGWDPTWLFLFMGGTATVFGLVLLLQEQRFGRALLNLGVVGLLLALIVIATPMVGMPPPPPGGGGLGLRPTKRRERRVTRPTTAATRPLQQ